MAKAKTEVKKDGKTKTEVATTAHKPGPMTISRDQVPDHLKGRTTAARGSENVQSDDLVIPRLEILQALSPMCVKGTPEYNPKAEPGMLVNSVTNEMYGDEVIIVPVFYDKQWLVWKDQSKGGGFFGSFPDSASAQARCDEEGGKAQGIEVIDTPTHFCLLLNVKTGDADEIVISMPRTKAKVSRQWNSMIRMAKLDRFAMAYKVSGVAETNKKNQSYHNFHVEQIGYTPTPVFKRAEVIWEGFTKGTRKATMDTTGYDAGTGEEGGAGEGSGM